MNTDRALVLQFLQGGRKPTLITSNPLVHDLGGELLELDAELGSAVLAFTPSPRFVQGAQVLQGGVIAALLDFAMAFAAHAALASGERTFSTATLNVNFLRAAPPGRYLARGRIVRAGRKILFAAAELASDAALAAEAGGRTIASASAVMPLAES